MGHNHTHQQKGKALAWAIVINIVLTVVQVIGGLISGSLSLLADALHNFSDAGALIVAYIAEKVSGLPANKEMTFGYGRAQILGALINSVTLVMVGLYLIYESWQRFQDPSEIDGWMVIWVAGVALVVDLATAWLTHTGSKESINMRAAFVHNLSDALASVVVIISGILILKYNIFWVDLVATLLISFYILYQSIGLIKGSVRILMQAVPEDLDRAEIISRLKELNGVEDVHHVHVWEIHEKFRLFEAHVVLKDIKEIEVIRSSIKTILKDSYKINHSTLEIETVKAALCTEER